jgi:hypothetical protein
MVKRLIKWIHSFISIQPLGRFGRNQSSVRWPVWLWHAASWANFLGVVCHYFPPLLDVPTFAARCHHVRNDARDPNSQWWKCGRGSCPVILPKWRLPRHLGIFNMPQIYDMGSTALLPLRRKACWGFFRPSASAGFEHANLGTKGQHATPRSPKPIIKWIIGIIRKIGSPFYAPPVTQTLVPTFT